jgi:hypothetical protein
LCAGDRFDACQCDDGANHVVVPVTSDDLTVVQDGGCKYFHGGPNGVAFNLTHHGISATLFMNRPFHFTLRAGVNHFLTGLAKDRSDRVMLTILVARDLQCGHFMIRNPRRSRYRARGCRVCQAYACFC